MSCSVVNYSNIRECRGTRWCFGLIVNHVSIKFFFCFFLSFYNTTVGKQICKHLNVYTFTVPTHLNCSQQIIIQVSLKPYAIVHSVVMKAPDSGVVALLITKETPWTLRLRSEKR